MFKKVFQYLVLGLGVYALIATLKRYIAKLSVDKPENLNAVLDYLGSPDLTYAKRTEDNVWQIIFYRTQHVKSDGITTIDECTGLLFKNGQLVLWGPSAYESYQQET